MNPGAEAYEEYERKGPDDSVRQGWRLVHPSGNQVQGSGRPQIIVTNRHLHDVAHEAWRAIAMSNFPPWLFQHAGQLAEIRSDDEDRPFISHMNLASMRGRLDRAATWLATKQGQLVPARPPKDVVEDMLALGNDLPILRGITGTPVFTSDGKLVTATGYQQRTRLYYQPVGKPLDKVPEKPTAQDLERAKSLLLDEFLCDFPFVDDASRANAISAVVTPALRELVESPVPLFAIDAPTPGSGKGLFAEGIGLIAHGARPSLMTEARGEEEQRKRITAALRDGRLVILIDNIKRRLDSAPLAAVLTATEWTDRVLGKSETVSLPNRSLWLATGNNLQLDGEITRRAVWIRLDSMVDRPWERAGFRHDPLIPWVIEQRHELVWAVLVLVRHWIAEERPVWEGRPLGSFESWCRVVGGVLQAAGIDGFLGNREQLYRLADEETEEWRNFVSAWWERFGVEPVKASDLHSLINEHELLASVFATAKDNASERSLRTRLGMALAERRDRRFGDLFIRRVGEDAHAKGAFYRLDPAENQDSEESEESEEQRSAASANVPPDKASSPDTNAEPAEPAEADLHLERETLSDIVEEGTAKEVPHLPHLPQTDSNRAGFAAEGVRNLAPDLPQDVPRCRLCSKRMSVTRISDLCGTCKAWDVTGADVAIGGS